jgi:hypothetical protein
MTLNADRPLTGDRTDRAPADRIAYYQAEIRRLVEQRNRLKLDLRERQSACEQSLLAIFARLEVLERRLERIEEGRAA